MESNVDDGIGLLDLAGLGRVVVKGQEISVGAAFVGVNSTAREIKPAKVTALERNVGAAGLGDVECVCGRELAGAGDVAAVGIVGIGAVGNDGFIEEVVPEPPCAAVGMAIFERAAVKGVVVSEQIEWAGLVDRRCDTFEK